MNKKLLSLSLLLSCFVANASEFMEFGNKDFKQEKMDKSRWSFELGANYLKYPATLPAYTGTHESVTEDETLTPLVGPQLSFGREFYLGAGFSTTIKLNAFYSKTTDDDSGLASEDAELKLVSKKNTHEMSGGDATISLNYMVENSVLNFQPFVEFGLGNGGISIRNNYSYDGLSASSTPNPEKYDIKRSEKFNYAKTSIGVNFISNLGFTFYMKVTSFGMTITDRSTKGTTLTQSATTTNYDTDDSGLTEAVNLTTASLGAGYLF